MHAWAVPGRLAHMSCVARRCLRRTLGFEVAWGKGTSARSMPCGADQVKLLWSCWRGLGCCSPDKPTKANEDRQRTDEDKDR